MAPLEQVARRPTGRGGGPTQQDALSRIAVVGDANEEFRGVFELNQLAPPLAAGVAVVNVIAGLHALVGAADDQVGPGQPARRSFHAHAVERGVDGAAIKQLERAGP